jgi:hypothetical protein
MSCVAFWLTPELSVEREMMEGVKKDSRRPPDCARRYPVL